MSGSEMPARADTSLTNLIRVAVVLVILKVTLSVVLSYRDYVPPNFQSAFLHGREDHFFGFYRWAFYSHIFAGPISLLLGLILLSERFRSRFPRWHRLLGRVQVFVVLLLLLPSGLWMSWYAEAGAWAGLGFATLSIATGVCLTFGWRAAMQRRFAEHRRWMERTYLLLSSAVVLRLIAGFAAVTGIGSTWIDPWLGWISWLVPLAVWECFRMHHTAATSQPNSIQHRAVVPIEDA